MATAPSPTAHTDADTIVYVPEDKVVFTGKLLFNEGHPIVWSDLFGAMGRYRKHKHGDHHHHDHG
jgi:glyoxylase-like metal-dependent hydrolase (beta-lactamase superfamily II)